MLDLRNNSEIKQIIGGVVRDCRKRCNNKEVLEFIGELDKYIKYSGEITQRCNIGNYKDVMCIHSINVAYINCLIGLGQLENMSERDGYKYITDVIECGLMHDIGKLFIDSSILGKNGRLTKEEREIMQNHPDAGYRLLAKDVYFKSKINVLQGVLNHHERLDGTGYPYGVTGETINLLARVTSVSDSYDAMTSYRIYNKMKCPIEAIQELKEMGNKYDRQLVGVLMWRFNSRLHEF